MEDRSNQWMEQLVEQIRRNLGVIKQFPLKERAIVREALAGFSVYELAQHHQVTESYVWILLNNAARLVHSWPHAVESAGLGSDTDPGVTGGYGDSGPGDVTSVPTFNLSETEETQEKE
jgi:DNA-binding CsgD family transcriptional regulator